MANLFLQEIELKELKYFIESAVKNAVKDSRADKGSTNEWMDLDDLIVYDPLKRSKQTFYRYVMNREIPFHKSDNRKKLLFKTSEIDTWLGQGRKQTMIEAGEEAIDKILNKKNALTNE